MKIPAKLLTAGILSGFLSMGAHATMVVFDDESGDSEIIQATITYSDFTVTGGLASKNLANGASFSTSDYTAKDVHRDTSPAHGGLGVRSGLTSDSDNFEGSLDGDVANDEILFFNFTSQVLLQQFNFNAGVGSDHQESFIDSTDVFGIFSSTDGINYTSLLGPNHQSPTDGEYISLNGGAGFLGQWFAVAHVGPIDSDGGYIEKIQYASVPEPGTLGLLGLGMLGVFAAKRRQRTA